MPKFKARDAALFRGSDHDGHKTPPHGSEFDLEDFMQWFSERDFDTPRRSTELRRAKLEDEAANIVHSLPPKLRRPSWDTANKLRKTSSRRRRKLVMQVAKDGMMRMVARPDHLQIDPSEWAEHVAQVKLAAGHASMYMLRWAYSHWRRVANPKIMKRMMEDISKELAGRWCIEAAETACTDSFYLLLLAFREWRRMSGTSKAFTRKLAAHWRNATRANQTSRLMSAPNRKRWKKPLPVEDFRWEQPGAAGEGREHEPETLKPSVRVRLRSHILDYIKSKRISSVLPVPELPALSIACASVDTQRVIVKVSKQGTQPKVSLFTRHLNLNPPSQIAQTMNNRLQVGPGLDPLGPGSGLGLAMGLTFRVDTPSAFALPRLPSATLAEAESDLALESNGGELDRSLSPRRWRWRRRSRSASCADSPTPHGRSTRGPLEHDPPLTLPSLVNPKPTSELGPTSKMTPEEEQEDLRQTPFGEHISRKIPFGSVKSQVGGIKSQVVNSSSLPRNKSLENLSSRSRRNSPETFINSLARPLKEQTQPKLAMVGMIGMPLVDGDMVHLSRSAHSSPTKFSMKIRKGVSSNGMGGGFPRTNRTVSERGADIGATIGSDIG